nr:DUF4864 domain-containing protein [Rhizobium gei]
MKIALACICVFAAVTSACLAEPIDDARSVIRQQVEAFLNDDADKAYSFASPQIRTKFPDKTIFFEMVKRSYAPVFRPDNFSFGRSKSKVNGIVQEVLISGPDGKNWVALYFIVIQPDGSQKINGVQILPKDSGKEI